LTSEDCLSVVHRARHFVLALALLANLDLIDWLVTTALWTNLGLATTATLCRRRRAIR